MDITSNKNFKLIIGSILLLSLIAALFVFYILDPEKYAVFPKCPFLLMTGLECPGCGTQRSIHQLLHLNIGAALRYNTFMVLALPYIFLGIYFDFFNGKARNPRLQNFFYGRWSAIVVLVIILAFWILRNL